jgi:hypothetical protein
MKKFREVEITCFKYQEFMTRCSYSLPENFTPKEGSSDIHRKRRSQRQYGHCADKKISWPFQEQNPDSSAIDFVV